MEGKQTRDRKRDNNGKRAMAQRKEMLVKQRGGVLTRKQSKQGEKEGRKEGRQAGAEQSAKREECVEEMGTECGG